MFGCLQFHRLYQFGKHPRHKIQISTSFLRAFLLDGIYGGALQSWQVRNAMVNSSQLSNNQILR